MCLSLGVEQDRDGDDRNESMQSRNHSRVVMARSDVSRGLFLPPPFARDRCWSAIESAVPSSTRGASRNLWISLQMHRCVMMRSCCPLFIFDFFCVLLIFIFDFFIYLFFSCYAFFWFFNFLISSVWSHGQMREGSLRVLQIFLRSTVFLEVTCPRVHDFACVCRDEASRPTD